MKHCYFDTQACLRCGAMDHGIKDCPRVQERRLEDQGPVRPTGVGPVEVAPKEEH